MLHYNPSQRSHLHGARGFSLVFVFLIGSLMVTATLGVVAHLVSRLHTIGVDMAYTRAALRTDEAYRCVKYWLNVDYRYFTDDPDAGTYQKCSVEDPDLDDELEDCITELGGTWVTVDSHTTVDGLEPHQVMCFDQVLDFHDGDLSNGTYASSASYGTSTFTYEDTVVEVVRTFDTSVSQGRFNGPIIIRTLTDEGGSYRSERYHKYQYATNLKGADVMFVIDRSGSISSDPDGDGALPALPRTPLTAYDTEAENNTEWAQLVRALTNTIREFIPAGATAEDRYRFGIVSFSWGYASSTGRWVNTADCPNIQSCLLQPDITLTKDPATLPSPGPDLSTVADDTLGVPPMLVLGGNTNISLGIALAGASLMGKYYPVGPYSRDIDFSTMGLPPDGVVSGWFERVVQNAVTSSLSLTFTEGRVGIQMDQTILADLDSMSDDVSSGDRPDDEYPDYIILITDGEPNTVIEHRNNSKLGYTVSPVGNTAPSLGATPAAIGITDDLFHSNDNVQRAMAHASLIKAALKQKGITFGVIGVGTSVGMSNWLRYYMADLPYVEVNSYADLGQGLSELLGGIGPVEMR